MAKCPSKPEAEDIRLGARIRCRRRELGLSQAQIAEQIGVTFQQVQKYENGSNRISFSRLVMVAGALECSATDLIGSEDKDNHGIFDAYTVQLNVPGATRLLDTFCKLSSSKRTAMLEIADGILEAMNLNLEGARE